MAEIRGKYESHYPWEIPQYNKISRFFSALEESKIESTKCDECNTIQWPPRSICSKCLSQNLSWIELPRKGVIVCFAKAYIGTINGENPPMIVAAVNLENGIRLLARVVGSRFEDLRVGENVRLAKTALIDNKPYWAFEVDT